MTCTNGNTENPQIPPDQSIMIWQPWLRYIMVRFFNGEKGSQTLVQFTTSRLFSLKPFLDTVSLKSGVITRLAEFFSYLMFDPFVDLTWPICERLG
jgi:hypothetical protein